MFFFCLNCSSGDRNQIRDPVRFPPLQLADGVRLVVQAGGLEVVYGWGSQWRPTQPAGGYGMVWVVNFF